MFGQPETEGEFRGGAGERRGTESPAGIPGLPGPAWLNVERPGFFHIHALTREERFGIRGADRAAGFVEVRPGVWLRIERVGPPRARIM